MTFFSLFFFVVKNKQKMTNETKKRKEICSLKSPELYFKKIIQKKKRKFKKIKINKKKFFDNRIKHSDESILKTIRN